MKTVVITGSARGLGYELAKRFRENNYNVVLSDINKENLAKAEKELGWKAEKGIDEMCADSYRWQSQNPNGYED